MEPLTTDQRVDRLLLRLRARDVGSANAQAELLIEQLNKGEPPPRASASDEIRESLGRLGSSFAIFSISTLLGVLRDGPTPSPEPVDEQPLANDEVDDIEAEEQAQLAKELETLRGWLPILEAEFPRYRWDLDENDGAPHVLGHVDLGDHLPNGWVSVDVGFGDFSDRDGWIEASAGIDIETGHEVPGWLKSMDDARGLDPRDPVRAVRVALSSLWKEACEHGVRVPLQDGKLVEVKP